MSTFHDERLNRLELQLAQAQARIRALEDELAVRHGCVGPGGCVLALPWKAVDG